MYLILYCSLFICEGVLAVGSAYDFCSIFCINVHGFVTKTFVYTVLIGLPLSCYYQGLLIR